MGERTFYVKVSFDDRPDAYSTMKAHSVADAAEQLRKWYANRGSRGYLTFQIQDHPFDLGLRPGRTKGYADR